MADITEVLQQHMRAQDGFRVFGRQTFEGMRGFWPNQTDDTTGITDHLNRVDKYVVSTTMGDPEWEHSTVLSDDPVEVARVLRERPGGDLGVTGSITLCHALIPAGIVDEYRLLVYPGRLGPRSAPVPGRYCPGVAGAGRQHAVPDRRRTADLPSEEDHMTTAELEQELRDLVAERAAAVRAKVTAPLAAGMADDVIDYDVLPPSRSTGSPALVEGMLRITSTATPRHIDYVHELTVATDGELGCCWFLYHAAGTLTAGDEVDMWVRATLCCRRIDGQWRIVHDHESVPFDADTGKALTGLAPDRAESTTLLAEHAIDPAPPAPPGRSEATESTDRARRPTALTDRP